MSLFASLVGSDSPSAWSRKMEHIIMKIALIALLAASVAVPAFAADQAAVNSKPQVFVKDSQKRVNGVVHIRAVSQDGKRVANVRVEKDGAVVGEVDGKKVNVAFEGI
jgi:hypothetical protein